MALVLVPLFVGASGTAPSGGVRQRLLNEIADLQNQKRRKAVLYRTLNEQIDKTSATVEQARREWHQAGRAHGKGSPQEQQAALKLETATRVLYRQISDRERLRYVMDNLEYGIQQRRLSLGYQEAQSDQSVWR